MVRAGDGKPLDLFRQGIRAEVTLARYTSTLRLIVCEFLEDILEGTFEERVDQLVKYGRDDPDWTRDLLVNLVRKLRERSELPKDHPNYFNPSSIPNYFMPIKKLFDMNDVVISWNRVYATYPELDNIGDSTGWSRKEIAKILKFARDPMDRALILVLASSGVRAGAVAPLNWGDLTPVYQVGDKLTLDAGEDGEIACVALEVYRGSSENYTTFVTPEAFEAIQEYGRAWLEMAGRQARPGDPIFIVTRGAPGGAFRRVSTESIRKRTLRAVATAGLRASKKSDRRHKVPTMNGFRRFFNKTCKNTPTPDTEGSRIRTEYMMGHRGVGALDKSYFKTTPLDLAEEYALIVPDLTIDDADRLRLSNRSMSDNVRRLEGEKGEVLARLEAKISEMERTAKEKDEKVARLERERDEAVAGGGSENDKEVALLRDEVAELKKRRAPSISDVLAALRKLDETDGISKDVADSLSGVFHQLSISKEATITEIRGEYDAKLAKVLNVVDWLAKKSGLQYDIRAELAEIAGDDEPPDTFPENRRDRGLC